MVTRVYFATEGKVTELWRLGKESDDPQKLLNLASWLGIERNGLNEALVVLGVNMGVVDVKHPEVEGKKILLQYPPIKVAVLKPGDKICSYPHYFHGFYNSGSSFWEWDGESLKDRGNLMDYILQNMDHIIQAI